jgi:hypothetical protein
MRDLDEPRVVAAARPRVTQDPIRPGPTRVRLVPEEIPVWALIGLGKALVEVRNVAIDDDIIVGEIAHDYGISIDAVRVALNCYERHPYAIDALLADNAAFLEHAASSDNR